MDNLTYEKRLISKAARSHTPINGSFELLPLCNMNCGMCYVRLSRPEMDLQGHLHSAAEWISLARQMQKSGTLFLLLPGGEPLLFPDFCTISAAAHQYHAVWNFEGNLPRSLSLRRRV